jgi:hypothetical protein
VCQYVFEAMCASELSRALDGGILSARGWSTLPSFKITGDRRSDGWAETNLGPEAEANNRDHRSLISK